MSCEHDLSECEVACADGYCPLCMVERIVVLEAALKQIAGMDSESWIGLAKLVAKAALQPEAGQ